MMRLYLIRHSLTEGNRKRRYIGRTDEGLCREGRELLEGKSYPQVQRVFASPRKRCLETAKILYPDMEPVILPGLAECDFGSFENHSYEELKDLPEYRRWIDSRGEQAPPGGESREACRSRTLEAFARAVELCRKEKVTEAALIVHGGTIMYILEAYGAPKREYYDYQVKNGEGYELRIDDTWNPSGSGRVSSGSRAGRSGMAVPSGAADREADRGAGENYQKLSP